MTREALEEEGVYVFGTIIGKRQNARQAFGTRPTQLHGYSDLYDEMMEATK